VVLAVLLWVRPKQLGPVPTDVARFLVGYFAYALPLLPLLALVSLPREPREQVAWAQMLRRRRVTGDDLYNLAVAVREKVFTRATGVVLATLGLLHLMRGAPSLTDGGTSRAGGLAGFLVGEPLRLAFSAAGGIGLLVAVLACAGLVIGGYVVRGVGRQVGYAAVAVAVAVPLVGTAVSHWFGYDYRLTLEGNRVVVVSALSATHRQSTYDTGLKADGLSASLRTLLTTGLSVADRGDGVRIANALAHPGTVAAKSFVGDQYELKIGDCFDWIGGSSQLRYVAPCNGAHLGEVYFVGHLPFKVDPGKPAVEAASRAMCEQSYGDYLGVPYGRSFLPMETPLMPGQLGRGRWTERPVIACWLGSVGPLTLRGTKTVAALQQSAPWKPDDGCKVEVPDALKVIADKPNTQCVAPGKGQRMSVEGGAFLIDLEVTPIGKDAGNSRMGVGCLDGADARSGYTFEVAPDGVVEIWKQAPGQRVRLSASAKPKGAGPPSTAATTLQVTCKVVPGPGVELAVTSGGGRKASVTDTNAPFTRLSPRLTFVSAETAPAVMTVLIFNAVQL
jgi:hypothetical protein